MRLVDEDAQEQEQARDSARSYAHARNAGWSVRDWPAWRGDAATHGLARVGGHDYPARIEPATNSTTPCSGYDNAKPHHGHCEVCNKGCQWTFHRFGKNTCHCPVAGGSASGSYDEPTRRGGLSFGVGVGLPGFGVSVGTPAYGYGGDYYDSDDVVTLPPMWDPDFPAAYFALYGYWPAQYLWGQYPSWGIYGNFDRFRGSRFYGRGRFRGGSRSRPVHTTGTSGPGHPGPGHTTSIHPATSPAVHATSSPMMHSAGPTFHSGGPAMHVAGPSMHSGPAMHSGSMGHPMGGHRGGGAGTGRVRTEAAPRDGGVTMSVGVPLTDPDYPYWYFSQYGYWPQIWNPLWGPYYGRLGRFRSWHMRRFGRGFSGFGGRRFSGRGFGGRGSIRGPGRGSWSGHHRGGGAATEDADYDDVEDAEDANEVNGAYDAPRGRAGGAADDEYPQDDDPADDADMFVEATPAASRRGGASRTARRPRQAPAARTGGGLTYLEARSTGKAGKRGEHKFWEIEVKGSAAYVRFGRVGASVSVQKKSFGTAALAHKFASKMIRSKLNKGYHAV